MPVGSWRFAATPQIALCTGEHEPAAELTGEWCFRDVAEFSSRQFGDDPKHPNAELAGGVRVRAAAVDGQFVRAVSAGGRLDELRGGRCGESRIELLDIPDDLEL